MKKLQSILVPLALVLLSGLTQLSCVGRIKVAEPTGFTLPVETYGRVGDIVWAIIGYRVGPDASPVGAMDATFDTVQVEVGGVPAILDDVYEVTSTKGGVLEAKVALFRIPNVGKTRHAIKILHNGLEVTAVGPFHVVVIPK